MISESNFSSITDKVIKVLEGGYYHRDMMFDGRLRYDARLESSGETMFGIDRKNGASLKTSPYWIPFWAIIDKANARKLWKWNYRGGQYENELRTLAGKIMFPHFTRLFNTYLSDKAKAVVLANPRLVLHFAYASWNGEGWFERFADKINNVAATTSNKYTLEAAALNSRTLSSSSLIRQSGAKMAKMFQDTPQSWGSGFNPLPLLLLFLHP